MISLETVTVSYSRSDTALQSLSLSIRAGEVTVVIGASGAGKSTLLRCLNGLIVPTEGDVRTDSLGVLSDERLRRRHRLQTGMVFQSPQLLERLTVLGNVLKGRLGYHSALRSLFPLPDEEIRRALLCLERVGILEKAHVRADRLSGGERQRVGIARALVQQPRLLLADEPIASLDPENGERVLSLLHRISKEDGLTVVLSLHQVAFARRYADRIVGLLDGRIVFDGPPADLDPASLRLIYRSASPPPSHDGSHVSKEPLEEVL